MNEKPVEFSKIYKARLKGSLRKDFEFYMSSQGMNESEAIRECIKSHVRKKDTSPDIQIRLRTIEMQQAEIIRKLS